MVRKYWSIGLGEYYRSIFKKGFVNSLQKLIPEITSEDIHESPAGVRAQALSSNGMLVDDFSIKSTHNSIHVINSPSPAATSSLSIGSHISKFYFENINE